MRRLPNLMRPSIAAGLAFACLCQAARAVDFIDVATTGTAGTANWLTPATWSPAVVPNNTDMTHYRVSSGRTLLLAGDVAIDSLAFTSQSALTLDPGASLAVEQSLNLGSLSSNSTRIALRRGTDLTLRNGAAISGLGTIVFQPFDGSLQTTTILAESTSPLALGSGVHIARGTNSGSVAAVIGDSDSSFDSSATVNYSTTGFSDTFAIRGSSIINRGQMLLGGGSTLSVGTTLQSASTIENTGLIRWTSSATAIVTAPAGVKNTGRIEVLGGGTLQIDGALDNMGGTILVDNSVLAAGGTILGSVGIPNATFANGGTLAIRGTYDNRGQVLRVDASSVVKLRIDGGTLLGGEIQTGDGRSLEVGSFRSGTARFDNVAINGDVSVRETLTVPAGQSFRGTGRINFASLGTLVGEGETRLEAELTVTGSGTIGDANRPLVNYATISSPQLTLRGSSIANYGSIATNGTSFIVGNALTRAALGNLSTIGNGVFVLSGTFLNDGQTLEIKPGNPQFSVNGTIRGGKIKVAEGSFFGVGYGSFPVFDNVELEGRIAFGQAVPISFPQGVVFGNADITLGPPPLEGPTLIGRNLPESSPGGVNGDLEIGRAIRISTPATTFIIPGFPAKGSGVDAGPGTLLNHGVLASSATDQTGTTTYPALSLTGATVQNDGTIRAVPTARVDVYGDLILLEGGTLATSMNASGLAGLIAIAGDLDLSAINDTLTVDSNLFAGRTPVPIIAFTGERVGTFGLVSPNFEIIYGTNQISIVAVPEPTLSLLAGLALWSRRRHVPLAS